MAKIGDALKRAVEVEPPSDEKTAKRKRLSSVLMSVNRLEIFQLLCHRPCLKAGDVTSILTMSRATVSWHLETLVETGYLTKQSIYSKDRYYPKGMIREGEPPVILTLLNDNRSGPLYRIIIENPGIDNGGLRELTQSKGSISSCILKLEESNLITAVKDGRHIRYYPTGKIKKLAKAEGSRMKAFQSSLMKRMKGEHLKPEIKDMKGRVLVIHIEMLGNTETIEIPHHPIETALAELDF